MKSTEARALIDEAKRAGVALWTEENQLRYKGPTEGLSENLRARLRSMKGDVIAELSRPAFHGHSETTASLRLPAYFDDFWRETASNPSLANATHMAVKIGGKAPLDRLYSAFRQVFSRHDLLRARLTSCEGVPCLLFDAEPVVPIKVMDLSAAGSIERPLQVNSVVSQTIWTPFEAGSLFRACLIRVSRNEYVFAFALHHLVGDLLSCHILLGGFLSRALRPTGPAYSPDTRPLQYSEYLRGMSEWLSGPALEYRLRYWKAQMQRAAPVALPGDHEVGSTSVAVLDSVCFPIDETLRAGIARVAAGSGVTLLAVMLAADFLALARTLQRSDLTIIPLISGRDQPALLDLVGMLVDCLPVRASVVPEMTFADLLQEVHKTYLLACSYHIPWALLRKTLREIEASCVAPLFNFVPAAYGHKAEGSAAALPNTALEPLTVAGPEETGSVDWKSHELHVFDSGRVMRGKVKYMPCKYRKKTIEAFIESFTSALRAIALNPADKMSVYLTR